MNKKVLVTGGAGFIGSNLIKTLINKGYDVSSIDNYDSGTEDNHVDGCVYYKGDVIDWLTSSNRSFDICFHLAGLSRIQPSFSNPDETLRVNTIGTQKVLEFARKTGAKMVYAGSSSRWHDPYQSPYATSKYLGEELCKMYRKTYNLHIEIARFYNVYGPGEIIDGDWAALTGIWRRQVRDGNKITIVGDGNQRRDFTYVGDIVDDVSNNITGIIIRRGTNYVTLEDKDMKLSKAWLYDIVETPVVTDDMAERAKKIAKHKYKRDPKYYDKGGSIKKSPEDKETGLPKKYVKGLSKDKARQHKKQLDRQSKMRDDDPNAYKQTAADKGAKTKPSKYTKKFKQMYGELKSRNQDPTLMPLEHQ